MPSGVQPGDIDQKGASVEERGVMTQDQETAVYSMKISQGEATAEDKANLTQTMSSHCAGKQIEKIEDVSVDEARFAEVTNGGIIEVDTTRRKLRVQRSGCSNLKVGCHKQ